MRRISVVTLATTTLLAGCALPGPSAVVTALGTDPAAACAALTAPMPASSIGIASGAASIDSASWIPEAFIAVAERGPTPAARVTPYTPAHCRVLGRIAPIDPAAPPIGFQVNLPAQWNGRSVQYGGGGFNGVLISGVGLLPAARFGSPTPLAQGYVTAGTDSGHQNVPDKPVQAFASNDEALVNFAYASYKKVRDVSVALALRAYGRAPSRLYFVGSSEGGREGLTMAQRYPAAFDGIFARVPVIHWTGLQLAGSRNGMATMGDAWLAPAQAQRVHDAVLAACDAQDGLADGIVSDPVGCKARFDVTALRCAAGAAGANCLTEAQVAAVKTLHSPYKLPYALANGVTEYPGWGVSGEATAAFGPTGGWNAWWLGRSAPVLPAKADNGIGWVYGSGAVQHFYARDPAYDVRRFKPEEHVARIQQVSALMDSTNPDLSAFHARGAKLIVLENLADYAQSPYAGIAYVESVKSRMGAAKVDEFLKLYAAPGVDHVGSGAPANVDMLPALVAWVEQGRAPVGLQLVEEEVRQPFPVLRARPLCEWSTWPRYRAGDAAQAASFECIQ